MRKRLLTLFLAVCFCFMTALPVLAVNEVPDSVNIDDLIAALENSSVYVTESETTAPQIRTYRRVIDDGELLTSAEEEKLETELDEISNRQQFDVVVVTANALGGKTPTEYADDYFDYNGYGYGQDRDGALLLVSMEERDWWISTRGYGITALTDYGIQQIGDAIVSYLGDAEYYEGLSKFADMCDDYVTRARNGNPVDVRVYDPSYGYYTPQVKKKAPFEVGPHLLLSFVIGFIAALIITGVMKGKLKSVRFQASANDYVNPGSLNITKKQDLFLYSHVTRTAIPKESHSGGGGGGSSTHVSSSGATHGGGGGKF